MVGGVQLALITARASGLFYASGVMLRLLGRGFDSLARMAWTLGCALLWVHAGAAFAVFHHWSHAEAVRFTTEQTARLTGVRSGAGIYLNDALLLAWTVDCAYWWIAGNNRYRRRSRMVSFLSHGFLLFMMINATIVFAAGPTRYVAILVLACLGLIWLLRRRE